MPPILETGNLFPDESLAPSNNCTREWDVPTRLSSFKMTQASSFQLRDHFPCIHLFRAVGIAFDIRKLLLGAIAWVVLAVGQSGIAYLPFAPTSNNKDIAWPHLKLQETSNISSANRGTVASIFTDNRTVQGWGLLLHPIDSVVTPGSQLLRNGRTWSQVAFAWTELIWAFVVWALFGVALARMTVVQFTSLDRIGIGQAMKFSLRQLQSTCTAPFIPLVGFGVLFALTSLSGLASSAMPAAGSFLFGVLWIFVLLIGFLMAMLLIGITLTWPLMIATIGTEDSDGFDAFSRALSYLLDRPWYLLLLSAMAFIVGAFGWAILNVIFGLTEHLAAWSVTAGFGDATQELINGDSGFAAKAASSWQMAFIDLLMGYIPAFFFSATTLIYLLVRQSDDGTALDVIADYDKLAADAKAAAEAPEQSAGSNETSETKPSSE